MTDIQIGLIVGWFLGQLATCGALALFLWKNVVIEVESEKSETKCLHERGQ